MRAFSADPGRTRVVAVRVAHFATAPRLVERSDLLLTIPASVAREARRTLTLSQRPVPLSLPAAPSLLAWHERFDRDPGHKWIRELLRRQVARG